MKSRIAVTLMLVLGMGLSTTGAGLAVTGSSDHGNAASTVYHQPNGGQPLGNPNFVPTPPGPTAATPPAVPPLATPTAATPPAPESDVVEDQGGVQGARDESDEAAPVSPVRVAEQAEVADATAGDSLPFTGFSAIPVLLAGLALMAGGLLMRRRDRAAGLL